MSGRLGMESTADSGSLGLGRLHGCTVITRDCVRNAGSWALSWPPVKNTHVNKSQVHVQQGRAVQPPQEARSCGDHLMDSSCPRVCQGPRCRSWFSKTSQGHPFLFLSGDFDDPPPRWPAS